MDFVKAKKYDPKKHQYRFFIEEKLDGNRLALKKGTAFFRGFRMNSWNRIPPHIQALAQDFFIEGELHLPGGTASDVKKIENQDKLRFCGYYVPHHNFMPPIHHSETIQNLGIEIPNILEIDQYRPSLEELEYCARQIKAEGFILKQIIKYPDWYKFKVEETMDVIVLGLTKGTGKYKNTTGALICGAFFNGKHADGKIFFSIPEVANVSGMSDEIRFALSEKDIGRICEVKFQEIGTQNRLRHPRFLRWRDDKKEPDYLNDFMKG